MDFENFVLFDGPESRSTNQVVEQILNVAEVCMLEIADQKHKVLEIEGRIGVIMQGHDRLDMPCETECILATDDKSFLTVFDAGLPLKKFHVLTEAVKTILKSRMNLYEKISNTRDDFISDTSFPNNVLRVTYEDGDNYKSKVPIETIFKERRGVYTFWTGKDDSSEYVSAPSSAEPSRFDFRIAINIENVIPNYQPGLSVKPKFTRKRKRVSFVTDLFQVDTTEVDQDQKLSIYEFEVELNSAVLTQELKKRLQQDSTNRAYQIIECFVNVIRDITAIVNNFNQINNSGNTANANNPTNMMARKLDFINSNLNKLDTSTMFADLSGTVPEMQLVKSYLNNISPVMPLIGDYLFRAVAPVLQAKEEGNPEVLANLDNVIMPSTGPHQWTQEEAEAALGSNKKHGNNFIPGGLSMKMRGGL